MKKVILFLSIIATIVIMGCGNQESTTQEKNDSSVQTDTFTVSDTISTVTETFDVGKP